MFPQYVNDTCRISELHIAEICHFTTASGMPDKQRLLRKLPRSPMFSDFSILMAFRILIFNADDLSLVVRAAGLADSVGHHQGAALAALH
jgi:hypothetical protein